jgi:pyruvate kinase
MRKTKIVATLGPATETEERIMGLIEAGADALRFNFSHGDIEWRKRLFERAKKVVRESGRTVAFIQDLQGPKVRVGGIPPQGVMLEAGERITISSGQCQNPVDTIPVCYANLEREVHSGEVILMDDGKLRIKALSVDESGVMCEVLEGGLLLPNKGVNFPQTNLSIPGLTPKDIADLEVGMQFGFDAVALSFVSRAEDVERLRREMRRIGAVKPIIAKLERAACVSELGEILRVSDAVMVARGDLGVEVDIKRVPALQKEIIKEANRRGIPVITATQMLESMTNSLLPTRAEAADVANAVFDGTDALMLSAETSIGKYPVEAVRMMRDIAVEAESYEDENCCDLWTRLDLTGHSITEALCHTAVVAAHDMILRTIIAVTGSGRTARQIARYRPGADVYAFTFDESTRNFMAISRGIQPHLAEYVDDFNKLMDAVDDYVIKNGIGAKGELIAIAMGWPIGIGETTNMMTIHRIGEYDE